MTRRICLVTCCLLAALCLCHAVPAQEIGWDVDGLCRVVQPMRHSMKGRVPLMCWALPLPRGEALVAMRQDGSLRRAIDLLAARGIVPTVEMGWNWQWTAEGLLALAQTLQEAGRPVHIQVGGGMDIKDLYGKAPKVLGPSPWDKEGKVTWTGEAEWPVLPLYDTSKPAAYYRDWMQRYKAAGVTVAGVWSDWEDLPGQYNFVYESQKKPDAAKYYPAGTLDTYDTFAEYVGQLRTKVLEEAFADPVHSVFPHALVANYADCGSSRASPFVDAIGAVSAPRSLGRLNATMPAVYANTIALPRYYNLDWPVTQEDADNVYFSYILRSLSTALANKEPGQLAIPYVSRAVGDDPDPRYAFGMSQGPYREVLRHAFLRGADGLYIFIAGPGPYETNVEGRTQYFESIEDARSVLDELLGFREFREQGRPMNFDLPAMRTNGIVWSGLALPDEVLVRTFTFGPESKTLDLAPFPGVAVKLEVTDRGDTYLIRKDGSVRHVSRGLT